MLKSLVARLALILAITPLGIASAKRSKKPVVAVLYFDNNTGQAQLDVLKKGLADMMVTDLSQVEDLVVVERAKLQSLLKELKLQRGRYFNKKTAVRIGKGLGARYAVTGAIAAVEPQLRLDVRLIDVRTSKVLVADKVVGPKDRFFELQGRLVNKFVQGLNIRFAFKPKLGMKVPNLKTLLDYSAGVDLADEGRLKEAEEKLSKVIKNAPTFGLARTKRAALMEALQSSKQRRVQVKAASGDALQQMADDYLRSKKLKSMTAEEAGVYLAYRAIRGAFILRALDVAFPGKEHVRVMNKRNKKKLLKLVKGYIKNMDLLIEERDSLLSKHPNIRAQLSKEDQQLAQTIQFEDNVAHGIVSAELKLGEFILLGKARYLDKGGFIIAPTPANLIPKLEKTGFAMLERAEKRFAAKKLDHMVVQAVLAGGEALMIRGKTEAAVKRWQAYLDKNPSSKFFKRVEGKIQLALGMKSDNSSRQLKRYEDALSSCGDMDVRLGGEALIKLRVRTEGLVAIDRVIDKLEKTCKAKRSAKSGWSFLLGSAADLAGGNGDCERANAYRRQQLEAGASPISTAKVHERFNKPCENVAANWKPEPVCWSIDLQGKQLHTHKIKKSLDAAGRATAPPGVWYNDKLWFRWVHPKQIERKMGECRALIRAVATGDKDKATLTLELLKGKKAKPFKVKLGAKSEEAKAAPFERAWSKYVWKHLATQAPKKRRR